MLFKAVTIPSKGAATPKWEKDMLIQLDHITFLVHGIRNYNFCRNYRRILKDMDQAVT